MVCLSASFVLFKDIRVFSVPKGSVVCSAFVFSASSLCPLALRCSAYMSSDTGLLYEAAGPLHDL